MIPEALLALIRKFEGLRLKPYRCPAGVPTIGYGHTGPDVHMDMPPMTMVFVVKDTALLDKTSVGAKIQFMATNEKGQMTVTDIQPAK